MSMNEAWDSSRQLNLRLSAAKMRFLRQYLETSLTIDPNDPPVNS
jgi:hypothetical protein